LYEFYVSGGTNEDKTVMSCRADGYVDLWEQVAGDRQLWRFTKLSSGLYTINVNGGTDEGKEYFTADKESRKISLTKRDPKDKLQEFDLVKLGKGIFNIKLPELKGYTFLSSRVDGYVDMWKEDTGNGRQKWKLVEREVEVEEETPKHKAKKEEKKEVKEEKKP